MYVISVSGGSGAVVSYNRLTRDGSNEERERAVVGLQKLPEKNIKRGKERSYLEFS